MLPFLSFADFKETKQESLGQVPDQREPTVAVAVRRTALDKTMFYLSWKRMKLKTPFCLLNISKQHGKMSYGIKKLGYD